MFDLQSHPSLSPVPPGQEMEDGLVSAALKVLAQETRALTAADLAGRRIRALRPDAAATLDRVLDVTVSVVLVGLAPRRWTAG